MNFLKNDLKMNFFFEIVFSIIIFIFGLLLIINSKFDESTMRTITSILLIIMSALIIYSYLNKERVLLFKGNIIFGIVALLLSLLTFINGSFKLMLMLFLITIGIQKFYYGYLMKKYDYLGWLFTFIIGIFFITIAIIFYTSLRGNLIYQVALYLLGYSALNILNVFLIKKNL